GVHLQSVAVNQVKTFLLRQTVGDGCKTSACIQSAGDNQFAIHWIAKFVFNAGYKPSLLWILRMNRDSETKRRRCRMDALPIGAAVAGIKNTVVVLYPEMVWLI